VTSAHCLEQEKLCLLVIIGVLSRLDAGELSVSEARTELFNLAGAAIRDAETRAGVSGVVAHGRSDRRVDPLRQNGSKVVVR
jgi:hypothetical protein